MYKKIMCLTSLILLLGVGGVVQATTYYVSPSGNDTTPEHRHQRRGKRLPR